MRQAVILPGVELGKVCRLLVGLGNVPPHGDTAELSGSVVEVRSDVVEDGRCSRRKYGRVASTRAQRS